MAAKKKKKKSTRTNASFRKTKKAWQARGHNIRSSKKSRRAMKGAPRDPGPVKLKSNPPKGWIQARRVKIMRKRGKVEILIDKPKKRSR